MSDYTTKERETIARAWTAILRIHESDDRATRWLESAYKYERKERSTKSATEALLIECWLDGFHRKYKVGDLMISEGCAKVVIVGAFAGADTTYPPRVIVTESDVALLTGAVLVNAEARDRRLEALRAS